MPITLSVLTIQARATGRRRPLVPDRELPTDGWGAQTLRELIERVVREEVAAFEERRAERGFLRVLTERDLADGAERGRIVSGGEPRGPRADPDAAVAVALQAFEDGVYLVLVDGRPAARPRRAVLLLARAARSRSRASSSAPKLRLVRRLAGVAPTDVDGGHRGGRDRPPGIRERRLMPGSRADADSTLTARAGWAFGATADVLRAPRPTPRADALRHNAAEPCGARRGARAREPNGG